MELKLGTNKVVELTPWKSKTKKDFIKVFRESTKDEIKEREIINILVMPYIDKPDVYYSAAEIQYILINLRKISITEDIKFSMDCFDTEKCGKDFDVVTDLDKLTNYKESNFPLELNKISWRDLTKKDALRNLIKKYSSEPPKELELLIHIESYDGTTISSIPQITEIIDDLTLTESAQLEEDFNTVTSALKIEQELTCPHCNLTKNYNFDIIPTFFDPLLPKDM